MSDLDQDIQLHNASAKVRYTRDYELAQTDWWAVSDRVMSQEQIDYRQALRDVTSQEGFPYNIVWPINPMDIIEEEVTEENPVATE